MPYIRPSAAQALSPEAVEQLARAVGVPLWAEDVAPLATLLTDQLASVGPLERLDLGGVDLLPGFDPRWPEPRAQA